MRVLIKIVSAVAGFVLGFIVSLLATGSVQLLFGEPRPRPTLLVLIGAILVAVAAWRRAPAPETVRAWLKAPLGRLPSTAKLAIAFAVPWMLSVWLATYAFRLFNGYGAAPRYYALLLAPPMIFLVSAILVRWAFRSRSPNAEHGRLAADAPLR